MQTHSLVILALSALGLSSPSFADRGGDGNVNIIYWQAPSILNPYLTGGTKDLESSSLVVEPLGRYDNTGALVAYLAEEIPTVGNGGVSADLTSITWKLKPGLLWSDGSAVTSEDVKFSADYCLHPDMGCASLSYFAGVSSVDIVDDLTVTVNFDAPKPNPYGPFMGYTAPILQKAQFEIVWAPKPPNAPIKISTQLARGPLL